MSDSAPTLALFDLDGTLTDRDTFLDLLTVSFGRVRTMTGLLATLPWIVSHAVGLCSAHTAKERVFRWFFGGMPEAEFRARTRAYSREHLPERLRPGALEKLQWHRDHAHDVWIVSASLRQWIEPWALSEGLRVIATEPEMVGGVITGRLATPNCRGEEKVRRIREVIDLAGYDRVFAYGDTPQDRPMLALATDPVYRPFREET